MIDIIKREIIYLWYYVSVITEQIAPYWVIGILIGSIISVFAKDKIHTLFLKLPSTRNRVFGMIVSSVLGILSPLCMYGTIPIAASFSNKGMKDDYLSAFMVSSILLNPQLIIYSVALGKRVLLIRIASAFLCGVLAGVLIKILYKDKNFLSFYQFRETINKDTHSNILLRLVNNIARNIKATGLYFLIGIILSALFQRYVPTALFSSLFIKNKNIGVFIAGSIGIPLYVCGGGTIPLLLSLLDAGMSEGAASAFMITGQAMKMTNLSAIKIVLGLKRFIIYLLYIFIFSYVSGIAIDIFL